MKKQWIMEELYRENYYGNIEDFRKKEEIE